MYIYICMYELIVIEGLSSAEVDYVSSRFRQRRFRQRSISSAVDFVSGPLRQDYYVRIILSVFF